MNLVVELHTWRLLISKKSWRFFCAVCTCYLYIYMHTVPYYNTQYDRVLHSFTSCITRVPGTRTVETPYILYVLYIPGTEEIDLAKKWRNRHQRSLRAGICSAHNELHNRQHHLIRRREETSSATVQYVNKQSESTPTTHHDDSLLPPNAGTSCRHNGRRVFADREGAPD
jgi:hypothetical protein